MSSADRARGAPPADPDPDRGSFRALTPRQRALLGLALLTIPVLCLALIEGALRLGGYGSSYPLFVPVEASPEYRMPNPEVGQRYFRHQAGTPVPMAELFRAEKSPDTYRVFVQGASTVAGFPYGHGGAFGRMLEQRLQETFPDREIEVVIVALDATNSHTLRNLAPEIIAEQPDAVLIYAGHNEYYGVLGVASSESVGRSARLVDLYLGLRRLRVVQAWQQGVEKAAGFLWRITDRPPPATRTLMEYLASEHTVRYGTTRFRAGISQLERNLDGLLGQYRDAGIPVFIGTLASNDRDQPPLLGRPAPETDTLRYNPLLQRATRAIRDQDRGAAETAIDALIRIDSTAADPFFLQGRLMAHEGRHDAARAAFVAARDRDGLPFRAPSAMNRVIRTVAERHGAHVVETLETLQGASPGQVVGSSLMLEHLHPNVTGQFLLADAFYRALRETGEIGDWSDAIPVEVARSRVPVTAVDSLAARMMVSHLTARFPFRPAGTRSTALADTLQPATPVEQIALAYHRGQLPWLRAMMALQEHYGDTGQWEAVAHVNRVMAQEVAYATEPLLTAAQAAILAGNDERAMQDVQAAERRRATGQGAWLEGNLLVRRGDTASARAAYDRALRLEPAHRRAAAARSALGQLVSVERAASADPADPDAGAELAAAYFMTGQYERAGRVAERVLERTPDHPLAAQVQRQLQAIYRRPTV